MKNINFARLQVYRHVQDMFIEDVRIIDVLKVVKTEETKVVIEILDYVKECPHLGNYVDIKV